MVQLTSKSEVSDRDTFRQYNEFEGRNELNARIDVYVEESLFHTLKTYETIMIDVEVIDYFGRKMAQLTMKKLNA
ncbi:MAG: hypothetical protein ACOC44_05980 [Promethearchaeia archaeon]